MQQLLVRPENMKRIDTPELAKAYIDEQVAAIRAQVRLSIGRGRPEWGAEPGVLYYRLAILEKERVR